MSSSGGDGHRGGGGPRAGTGGRDGDALPREAGILLLLVTAPEAEARTLARRLVEERLAACGNVIPGVSSVYRWKGEVEEATEALLILKAPRAGGDALLRRIPELHSYDVPEILVLEVADGHPPYLDWVSRAADAVPGPAEG
jgi:periplasmic divalent cation tolerance protein